DVPVAEVSRRLRYDIEQQTDVFAVNAIPVTDHLTGVRVPQAVVAAVDASENLAHELGARRHREIDRRGGVPQHVDAPGHLNIVVQLTDDTGHGHRRDRLNLRQVGQAALVGEHDCVHAAFLQREQVCARPLHDPFHTGFGVVIGVARQGMQVAHGDDGLVDVKQV